ncbi:hypothetical protein IWQ62_004344 [Dispira parvispora]|uniref:Eukaryotic translation initiation factor 3 subunit K n=1 Tax=Dispira parvispora TaxID=1520584 RepID=A0A9W8AM37_9FUNG|nr:hypothetical protein IWQ62_004344 [Dispira parvispora]
MESTLAPSTRPEAIDQLLNSVERYNPDNVEVLEEYLNTQCQHEENDLAANLAILKLYQFNPHLINLAALVRILGKALTNFFEADFNLCLYLLNEGVVQEEVVVKLLELKQAVEESNFGQFWQLLDNPEYRELVADIHNFDGAMRSTISHVVGMAYQTMDLKLAEQYFHLEGEPLKQWLDQLKWTIEGSIVQIPANQDNQVEPTVTTESIQFSQLTKIIGHSSAV